MKYMFTRILNLRVRNPYSGNYLKIYGNAVHSEQMEILLDKLMASQ